MSFTFLHLLGTGMHIDPLHTDAFNGLLKGEKWWIAMPKDLYEFSNDLSCLESCSDNNNDSINYFMNIKQWYYHMLPQLR